MLLNVLGAQEAQAAGPGSGVPQSVGMLRYGGDAEKVVKTIDKGMQQTQTFGALADALRELSSQEKISTLDDLKLGHRSIKFSVAQK